MTTTFSPFGAFSQGTELRDHIGALVPELEARALRLTRESSAAQDLLQDTLERALRFESQYEPNSNLRAWVHRILLSVFVTRCRRSRRERCALESLTQDPCAWTHPDAPPIQQTLSPRAAVALAKLPSCFRLAVELVDLGDMSYRDAADIIGVPLGTVMSRLHRGRRMLAETLRDGADSLDEAA
ncbi:MAG TPA: RNA polymerase sigma factor [Polyangiaceae bacterium]|jgi:RNA polymerase sigma-70 factor (ECF subfamily)